MKWILTIVLAVSSLSLIIVLLRSRYATELLRRVALHFILAALVLYTLNYSGLIGGWEIPMNLFTVGTVMLLGLPGIALITGLRFALF